MRRVLIRMIAVTVFSLSCLVGTQARGQVEVPYRHGYDLGIGVILASGFPMDLGVKGDINSVAIAPGGSGGFEMNEITSTRDLEDTLGISATASGSVGVFSASARFDLVTAAKVMDTSLLLLIHSTQELGFKQYNSPSLTDDAAVLHNDIEQFHNRYGESFVRGMSTGGQFFGFIKIETRSSEEKREIKVKLGGSLKIVSLDADTDIVNILTSTEAGIYVKEFHEGGTVTTQATTVEDLFKAAREWRDTVNSNARPYAVLLAPYAIAGGPYIDSAALQHQRDVLRACDNLRAQQMDALNLVEYMMTPEHQVEFIPNPQGPPLDLPALHEGLSRDLTMIAEAASYAINNPKDAKSLEAYVQEVKHLNNYVLTQLPPNMPLHEGLIRVPDLVGLQWLVDAKQGTPPPGVDVAIELVYGAGKDRTNEYENRLHFDVEANMAQVEDPSRIVSQKPAAGKYVPTGSTVYLIVTNNARAIQKAAGW